LAIRVGLLRNGWPVVLSEGSSNPVRPENQVTAVVCIPISPRRQRALWHLRPGRPPDPEVLGQARRNPRAPTKKARSIHGWAGNSSPRGPVRRLHRKSSRQWR